jgi:hypothetical protein
MMTTVLLLGSVWQAGLDVPEFKLQYVRSSGDKYVLESEVTHNKMAGSFLYQSITHRPGEKMTLKLVWNEKHQLQSAQLEQETAQGKKTAEATFQKKMAVVKRPGQKDEQVAVATEPVLATTAPDWSDILIVLRRYDQKKGGKQEFAGLWFHPVKPSLSLTFTVEELGKDDITSDDKKLTLGRYRVHLRSGNYLVWADGQGQVYKLMPPGQPKAAVILKGQEKATLPLTGMAEK